jgi:hypothetical protein
MAAGGSFCDTAVAKLLVLFNVVCREAAREVSLVEMEKATVAPADATSSTLRRLDDDDTAPSVTADVDTFAAVATADASVASWALVTAEGSTPASTSDDDTVVLVPLTNPAGLVVHTTALLESDVVPGGQVVHKLVSAFRYVPGRHSHA